MSFTLISVNTSKLSVCEEIQIRSFTLIWRDIFIHCPTQLVLLGVRIVTGLDIENRCRFWWWWMERFVIRNYYATLWVKVNHIASRLNWFRIFYLPHQHLCMVGWLAILRQVSLYLLFSIFGYFMVITGAGSGQCHTMLTINDARSICEAKLPGR